MKKIDIYTHIIPSKYKDALYQRADSRFYSENWDKVINGTPGLTDLDNRLRILEKYEGLSQVLTIASPALEEAASPEDTIYLAELGNNELAELVSKYPDRFAAAIACLPVNDIDASLKEAGRTIHDLGMKGIQLYTPSNSKPLDSPEFFALYEMMAEYDLPVWIHPARGRHVPDYMSEDHSKYYIYQMFGWPYETTAAMVRLVFSGIFDKFPGIKFITHHCGAMLPFFSERLVIGMDYAEENLKARWKQNLKKPPIEYFREFYADTALNGNPAALTCGYEFFGPERTVFATDFPYDNENGERFTREVINAVESLDISDNEKEIIYHVNAEKLLHIEE